MRVGFVGLGIMGASLAANVQKAGHSLTVHDVRREAAAKHIACFIIAPTVVAPSGPRLSRHFIS